MHPAIRQVKKNIRLSLHVILISRHTVTQMPLQLSLCFMASVELLSCLSLLLIRHWALRKRQQLRRASSMRLQPKLLSMKFQLEETLRVTGLFLPLSLTKCGTYQFALFSLTLLNSVLLKFVVLDEFFGVDSFNCHGRTCLPNDTFGSTHHWIL